LRNLPTDQEILDAVNETARLLVNAEQDEQEFPPGFRCDMSRVGFIRRRWERAVEAYKKENGIDPIEALARIEAELRNPVKAPVLHA
jgi:hypothetical protein